MAESKSGKIKLLFFGYMDESLPYSRIGNILMSNNGVSTDFEVFCFADKNGKNSQVCSCPFKTNSKAMNYIVFSFCSFFYVLWSCLKSRDSVFVVPTTPPLILGFAVMLAKVVTFGNVKWIYHVQDIHPEVTFVNRKFGYFAKLLRYFDVCIQRSCDCIVTLSEDMKNVIIERDYRLKEKICVLNNPTLINEAGEYLHPEIEAAKKLGKIVCIFSGNIGNFQDVENVIKYFLDCSNDRLVLYLLGRGSKLAVINKLLENNENFERVKILGHFEHNQADSIVSQCHYGVVSLIPAISKLVYPSKLAAYSNLGVPVLCFVEPGSHISNDVVKSNLGILMYNDEPCQNGKRSSALNTLNCLEHNFDRDGLAARGQELFGRGDIAKSFSEIVGNLNAN